ncbi:DUF4376 domain-containing protein [Desulfovibrio sp. OttesenSCG-928-F07]|nr:DUF4376 domain-containing protein [Desulfovibrio sp. OttesenSCG-928-F07]
MNPPTIPEQTLEQALTAALETLRQRKWKAKNGGITVNGINIDTDATGQETISGAVLNTVLDENFTARWKTAAVNPDGTAVWITLDANAIRLLAKALTAHTEACFAVEETKQQELTNCTTIEQIEEWLDTELDKGWPNDN